MGDSEEPALRAERLFEQIRRFTDTWVTNTSHHIRGQKPVVSAVPVPGPCKAVLLEVQHSDARNLFGTGNPSFNKLAALLVHLVEQLRELQHRLNQECCARLMPFGEEPQLGGASREGEAQLMLARLLPFLLSLADDLDALQQLLENILLQLGALCVEHTRKATVLQGTHANTAFMAAAESLATLLRIEIVTSRNPNLASAFTMFSRMLGSVSAEAQDFDEGEKSAAAALLAAVGGLQERVIGRGAFRRFLEVQAGRGSELSLACGSPSFTSAAAGILRSKLAAVTTRIANGSDLPGDRDSLLGIVAMGALVFRLGSEQGAFDKRLLRQLLDLHQQVPLLPVYCELTLQPASFLSQYLPSSLDGYIPAAYARQAAVHRNEQLGVALGTFASQLQQSALALAAWMYRFDLLVESTEVTESLLTRMAAALLQGVALAQRTRHDLISILGQLKLGGSAIATATLRILVHAACQIKAVEHTFQRHETAIAEALPHLVTHVRSGIQGLLSAMGAGVRAKSRQAAGSQSLLASRAKRERNIAALQDAAIAIDAAHALANGPVSSMQLSGLATCLDAVQTTGSVPDSDLQRLQEPILTMRLLTTLPTSLQLETSCSFLYFHRSLLAAALKDLAARPAEARKLPLLVAAFADAHQLLSQTMQDPSAACQEYDDDVAKLIQRHLLLPTCDAVETQLRLHHHACHVTGEPPSQRQDVMPILRLEPIRLPTRVIHLRDFVEHELAARFYNHTAVALHDWHTYSQLALLAESLFSLDVKPPDLPGLVVDPGLDLVEVTKGLPAFVAGYAYSLVSQAFIQRVDASIGTKHLMTLGVPQLTNALRRHGIGLADAAVNAAYRLLARHFTLLSQWLYQDQVKSRLAKEVRSIQEGMLQEGSLCYRYEWAELLVADLRRLGTLSSGLPYLDHLRRLVTEMGNAMGLVRLVQQGKATQLATAAQFLRLEPGQPAPRFQTAVAEGAGPEVEAAAAALDSAIARLADSSNQGPDYYAVLTSVFKEHMSVQHAHLASFHAVVPALTLTAVEAALLSKEQLPHRRRSQTSAAFTDDGFALGLAFLLKVVGQEGQFDGLRWFACVHQHFEDQQAALKDGQAAAGGMFSKLMGKLAGGIQDESDARAQNRELARARLASYAGEFRLLQDAYGCAHLLFFKK